MSQVEEKLRGIQAQIDLLRGAVNYLYHNLALVPPPGYELPPMNKKISILNK